MAIVVLQPGFARRYTEGQTRLEVDAADYQALVEVLDERFPGFADAVAVRIAVAIDGQIFPDPLLEPIGPTSEVFFLPMLEGG
ncbi:MAG: MoaD/ThiS family protein [Gammaproteobacteria bacterium]